MKDINGNKVNQGDILTSSEYMPYEIISKVLSIYGITKSKINNGEIGIMY